jgi:hypothetical protein
MSNLKNKFRYGDIIAFKPTGGFVSKMISKVDGSPYSHIAIFWRYVDGVPLFLESHEARGGVVINKLQEWGNFDVFRPHALKPREEKEMLHLVGNRYDYSILWWIFKAKIFKKTLQNNDDTKVICSEYADYCYYYTLGEGKICTSKTIFELYKAGILKKI